MKLCDIWKINISGDWDKINYSGLKKEKAEKLTKNLNKKTNWTDYYLVVPQEIN